MEASRIDKFDLQVRVGSPAELVGSLPDGVDNRLACICRPTSTALVLGSAEPQSHIDMRACEVRSIAVLKRRSGGGAVLVGPGRQVWLDVYIPSLDPLADHDVARATWWLGEVWRFAIGSLIGDAGLVVHHGPLLGRFAKSVCYLGLGPGEVSRDKRKLVGISQRRSKQGAWLFSMGLIGRGEDGIVDLLNVSMQDRDMIRHDIQASVGAIDVQQSVLENALLDSLSQIELGNQEANLGRGSNHG